MWISLEFVRTNICRSVEERLDWKLYCSFVFRSGMPRPKAKSVLTPPILERTPSQALLNYRTSLVRSMNGWIL